MGWGRGVPVLSLVYEFLYCNPDSQSCGLRGGVKHVTGGLPCWFCSDSLSFPSLGFPGGLRPYPSPVWDASSLVTAPVASGTFFNQTWLILFSVSEPLIIGVPVFGHLFVLHSQMFIECLFHARPCARFGAKKMEKT